MRVVRCGLLTLTIVGAGAISACSSNPAESTEATGKTSQAVDGSGFGLACAIEFPTNSFFCTACVLDMCEEYVAGLMEQGLLSPDDVVAEGMQCGVTGVAQCGPGFDGSMKPTVPNNWVYACSQQAAYSTVTIQNETFVSIVTWSAVGVITGIALAAVVVACPATAVVMVLAGGLVLAADGKVYAGNCPNIPQTCCDEGSACEPDCSSATDQASCETCVARYQLQHCGGGGPEWMGYCNPGWAGGPCEPPDAALTADQLPTCMQMGGTAPESAAGDALCAAYGLPPGTSGCGGDDNYTCLLQANQQYKASVQ